MKQYCYVNSPIGNLLLAGTKKGLETILFPYAHEHTNITAQWSHNEHIFSSVRLQLFEYFQGKRREFTTDLNLRGTVFQVKVWRELQKIPFGRTESYSNIAKKIGNSRACRAVGMANNRNPVPIIIPCHRVIGKNGTLTGFGGGVDLKQKLLKLEGVILCK